MTMKMTMKMTMTLVFFLVERRGSHEELRTDLMLRRTWSQGRVTAVVREREEVVRGDPIEEMVGRKEETGDCGERGIVLDERETALKHECLPV